MKNIVDLRRDRPRAEAKKLLRITGLPAVAALFATTPGRVEKLFFDREVKSLVAGFCAILARARKSYRLVGPEHVELYRAVPFVPALGKLRRSHLVVGAAAEGGRPIGTLARSERPFALVLGNEEAGLRPATLKACDEIVTIAGSGSIQSLKVAASAAILIYAMASGATVAPR